jgi:hypothetical protein
VNARQPAAPRPTGTTPGRDRGLPPRTSGQAVPQTIDAQTMAAALADGSARTLNSTMTRILTYRGQWWLDHDDTWLLITDQTFTAALDGRVAAGTSDWAHPKLKHGRGGDGVDPSPHVEPLAGS